MKTLYLVDVAFGSLCFCEDLLKIYASYKIESLNDGWRYYNAHSGVLLDSNDFLIPVSHQESINGVVPIRCITKHGMMTTFKTDSTQIQVLVEDDDNDET